MKIKEFYYEKNEIEDISRDYVVIKMKSETWRKIRFAVWLAQVDKKELRNLFKLIDKRHKERQTEWY